MKNILKIKNIIICSIFFIYSKFYSQDYSRIPICTEINAQASPVVISDDAGGVIIAWLDNRTSAALNSSIYAQRINSQGQVLWTNNGISIGDQTSQNEKPKIIKDGLGGAFVVWSTNKNISTGYDIYVQHIDSNGNKLYETDGKIICDEILDQVDPEIVLDNTGNAIIAWADSRFNYQKDIYIQKINAIGINLWANNGVVLCNSEYDQFDVEMIADSNGGVIFIWTDKRFTSQFGAPKRVYGQQINNNGAFQWENNGLMFCSFTPEFATIVSDDAGGAIITWGDARFGISKRTIWSKRINSTGNSVWANDEVIINSIQRPEALTPKVVKDGFGGAIITWYETRGNTRFDVYAQKINATGQVQWTINGLQVCGLDKDQNDPVLASDANGGAIIAWQDQRLNYNAIFAQNISSNGLPMYGDDGMLITDQYPYTFASEIGSDGNGGAVVTWCKGNININIPYDIYASHISTQLLNIKSSKFDENKITIYSNPVQNYLKISSKIKISKLTLFNSLGQVIDVKNSINNLEAIIDVNQSPAGIYYYKIIHDNEGITIGKFLKK